MRIDTLKDTGLDGQRLEALRRANHVRVMRAALKRDLAAGRVELLDILSDPPEWLLTARVRDLVGSLKAFGPAKTQRCLTTLRLSDSTTIARLSDRQHELLVGYLKARQ